ncbi:MAG: phosphotransferase family protein, partial [Candidatus Thorarchaeota archaeon]
FLSLRFPDWSSIDVTGFRNITSGWETDVFSFDVEYAMNGVNKAERLVARVYPGSPGAYRANFEFDLLKAIHEIGFPVPRVLLVETESDTFEKPFIIMDRIVGKTMREIMLEGNEARQSEMVDLFSRLFVEMHRLDWKQISMVPERYLQADPQSLFIEHLEGLRGHISRNNVDYLVPIIDWLMENIQNIDSLGLSLLHRDFHPMNILIDSNGKPFVIDWTAAMIGDPRIDVAWSLLLAKLHFREGLENVFLRGYEKVLDARLKNMDFFMVDACIRRLSDILISLKSGPGALGMRAATADEMKTGIALLLDMHEIVENTTGLRIAEIDRQVKILSG